ncbi:MAG TPA: DUF2905 domain-containing protein [Anaerolineales bacterium]|nr:DUF2905 domain-containing protein [Anaerolineales bacterium]
MYVLSKLFLVVGAICIVLGILTYMGGRYGLPVGRLPGDFRIDLGGGSLYVPLATSLLLSVVLTLAANIILRIFRK